MNSVLNNSSVWDALFNAILATIEILNEFSIWNQKVNQIMKLFIYHDLGGDNNYNNEYIIANHITVFRQGSNGSTISWHMHFWNQMLYQIVKKLK